MNRNTFRRSVLGTQILLALILVGFLPKPDNRSAHFPKDTTSKQCLVERYGKLPLSFEANDGQTDSQVKFLSRGPGYTVFLTRNAETILMLNASTHNNTWGHPADTPPVAVKSALEHKSPFVIRMKLLNARAISEAQGLEELPGRANYFIGNDPKKWRSNVTLFAKVEYRNVYPGVDLVYYGNQQQLEHDFIVAPGADPHSITLNFEGAEKLSLDAQGELVLAAKEGDVRLEKPRIYQQVDGARREISGVYVLKNANQVGFQVAAYDATKPLVIDPTLSYSTYLGGSSSGGDNATGIAVDGAGNAYAAGTTFSADFPITPGAYQVAYQGNGDVFVTKMNPGGTALIYSTFIGGDNRDDSSGIAVDPMGNVYVTGHSYSANFPTTPGAFQGTNKSAQYFNAFVTKLDSTGSVLVYSTYLGGYYLDSGEDIALDAAGDAFVTGYTQSSDFPTTPDAFQTSYPGYRNYSRNAFVTKLNPAGSALVYSTYLGGSGSTRGPLGLGGGDQGTGIAVDADGSAFIAGYTASSDFPTTIGALQPVAVDQQNAFVTKLNNTGSGLVYSTYLGGATGGDWATGIAIDNAGAAYVTGVTNSVDFPTTAAALQPVAPPGTAGHAFATKLNQTGSALVYSSYLGGSGADVAYGVAVDAVGNVYVTGGTNSTDFPTTPDAFQTTKAGSLHSYNVFVTVLNPSNLASQSLLYSTYLGGTLGPSTGGTSSSFGARLAVDTTGNAYVTGWTYSINFPTTPGAFQTVQKATFGVSNAFIAKFSGFPTPQ